MAASKATPWIVIAVCLALAGLIAAAVTFGQPGAEFGGLPLFVVTAIWVFSVQWLAFIPAYIYQTERYYDLIGSLTYISVVIFAVLAVPDPDPRSQLLAGLILLWAGRLGSFLFRRISQDGGDHRFDNIKPHFGRFLQTWTLQGLWVFMTACCALAAMTTAEPLPLGLVGGIGLLLWVSGFVIEVVADQQKRSFRKNPDNEGRFINTGLWAWCQHPNYFGEITLWTGIAVIAVPVLQGAALVTLISPVFVALLLLKVSGVPMLRAAAEKRWGDDPEYRAYRDRTPTLIPRPPRH